MTVEALTVAGLTTKTIRTSDTAKERTDIINAFNNHTTPVDVLVANINSLVFSINQQEKPSVIVICGRTLSAEVQNYYCSQELPLGITSRDDDISSIQEGQT